MLQLKRLHSFSSKVWHQPVIRTHAWRHAVLFMLLFFAGNNQLEKGSHFFMPQHTSAHALLFNRLLSEEEIEFLDFQITQLLTRNQFNGNVLIARYGMVLYQRSFGFASFTRAEPLNAETSFQLASISKTFTGAAILMLQHQGKLHVSDKVKQHIPEFPYDNITITHLLTHTSGLQNYMWLVERQWQQRNLPTNEDVLKLFIQHRRPLNFSPGLRFEYSNTGYVFLGLLIERVSGQSYADFIEQHIFEPLEMTRSFVYDLHNPRPIDNRAFGYRQHRGRNLIIPDDKLDGPLGDKGIFSTTGDLYKWDQALHRSALLPPELWQQAFDYGRLSNDSTVNYGFGWRLQKYLDKKIVHHPGRWRGFRNSFKRFPEDHTSLILLSNNNRNIAGLIEGIQDILYYEEKEIWMSIHGEVPHEDESEAPEPMPDAVPTLAP